MSTIIASLIVSAICDPTEGWMRDLKIESFYMGRPSATIVNASTPRLHDLWHALVDADFSRPGERIVGWYQDIAAADHNSDTPDGWDYDDYDSHESADLITLAAIGIDAYDFYKWCRTITDLEFHSDEMRDMLPVRVDCEINGTVTITKI